MKTLIVFLLIWLVGLDAFKLTQIVETAEEEIMQEMKDYNANKQPTNFGNIDCCAVKKVEGTKSLSTNIS